MSEAKQATSPTGATVYTVAGYGTSTFFQKSANVVVAMEHLTPSAVKARVLEFSTQAEYEAWLPKQIAKLRPSEAAAAHSGSPLVWEGESSYIGSCDELLDLMRQQVSSGSPRPQLNAAPDVDTGSSYDYDLVVIGGGSGGLAAAKSAAELGARVLLADYVKPSPQGSTWGLGGTCVNVGCIPKKLMHRAALLGEATDDAASFGWTDATHGEHDWSKMVANVQDYIRSLNFGYRASLRDKRVEYANALATFKDSHAVHLRDASGSERTVTARRVLVAVGGRPRPLACPGGELAISSDDVFSLPKSPGKTLIIGASYIALETAGFLAGLGLDVTVMVRSIVLRGFDRDIAGRIADDMASGSHAVRFLRGAVPDRLERQDDGRVKVFWSPSGAATDSKGGEEKSSPATVSAAGSEVFDTVLAAIGRVADTSKLGLERVGITPARNGKIPCVDEQTCVPHVYAIGDVMVGCPELTPVAIQAGRLLSNRLFHPTKREPMDYRNIATTVFTPLEYGCIGLSEEDAIEELGSENVEVYHSAFTPLEWAVVDRRPENQCYAKLVTDKSAGDRVIGLHFLGPNAGEVVQGFAVAMKRGATYHDFNDTVGIHPTTAEEFTTMRVTKSSGESADAEGC